MVSRTDWERGWLLFRRRGWGKYLSLFLLGVWVDGTRVSFFFLVEFSIGFAKATDRIQISHIYDDEMKQKEERKKKQLASRSGERRKSHDKHLSFSSLPSSV